MRGTEQGVIEPVMDKSVRREQEEDRTAIMNYVLEQPENVQVLLEQALTTLRRSLPDARERIAWRMPTFYRERDIIHIAAFKNHIGLYPGAEAIVKFADRLGSYKTSKGAIQFPFNEPLPLELIADIAIWCDKQKPNQEKHSQRMG